MSAFWRINMEEFGLFLEAVETALIKIHSLIGQGMQKPYGLV